MKCLLILTIHPVPQTLSSIFQLLVLVFHPKGLCHTHTNIILSYISAQLPQWFGISGSCFSSWNQRLCCRFAETEDIRLHSLPDWVLSVTTCPSLIRHRNLFCEKTSTTALIEQRKQITGVADLSLGASRCCAIEFCHATMVCMFKL